LNGSSGLSGFFAISVFVLDQHRAALEQGFVHRRAPQEHAAPKRRFHGRGLCGLLNILEESEMLKWALIFAIVALIAGGLGFTGLAGAAAGIAKLLFVLFLIGFVVFLVLGFWVGRKVAGD
jgi:uncharacterized membrane protein YtjA (UPF0391 family)